MLPPWCNLNHHKSTCIDPRRQTPSLASFASSLVRTSVVTTNSSLSTSIDYERSSTLDTAAPRHIKWEDDRIRFCPDGNNQAPPPVMNPVSSGVMEGGRGACWIMVRSLLDWIKWRMVEFLMAYLGCYSPVSLYIYPSQFKTFHFEWKVCVDLVHFYINKTFHFRWKVWGLASLLYFK